MNDCSGIFAGGAAPQPVYALLSALALMCDFPADASACSRRHHCDARVCHEPSIRARVCVVRGGWMRIPYSPHFSGATSAARSTGGFDRCDAAMCGVIILGRRSGARARTYASRSSIAAIPPGRHGFWVPGPRRGACRDSYAAAKHRALHGRVDIPRRGGRADGSMVAVYGTYDHGADRTWCVTGGRRRR